MPLLWSWRKVYNPERYHHGIPPELLVGINKGFVLENGKDAVVMLTPAGRIVNRKIDDAPNRNPKGAD